MLRLLFSRAASGPVGAARLPAAAFSPNTVAGACPTCHGLGVGRSTTEELLVPDPGLSISDEEPTVLVGVREGGNGRPYNGTWYFARKRLGPAALAVTFGGFNISELVRMPLSELCGVLDAGLDAQSRGVDEHGAPTARALLKDVGVWVEAIVRLGLGYLSMDRSSVDLSPGELQRIRLASQLRSGLLGGLYVMDEPSAGLHRGWARGARGSVVAALRSPDSQQPAEHIGRHPDGGHDDHHGVFGSGKSSLLAEIIERSPRSNLATYTGLFDTVRQLFAKNTDAQQRGFTASRFSLNVDGGRCPACDGSRCSPKTLEVQFDVGLEYLTLGQPTTELSGGEA